MASGLTPQPVMLQRLPIVILHRYAYGDSSWIVKALNPEHGVLTLLVKGGKSKDSPYRTSLDPLAASEVVIAYTPRREMHIPRDVSLMQWFPGLRNRLEDLAIAQVMAEILLRLGASGGHAAEEYRLLLGALEQLEKGAAPPDLLARWMAELAEVLGYAPGFEFCAQCGASLASGIADIWPALGGGVCAACLGTRRPAYTPSFLQEWMHFRAQRQPSNDPQCWQRIEHFYLHYLKVHTGSLDTLHSWNWLSQTRNVLSLCHPNEPQENICETNNPSWK